MNFTQVKGISGGHNANNFYTAVQQYGVKIVKEEDVGTGIKTISYQIPSRDRTGKIDGYRNQVFKKIIYDSNIFSDKYIYELGKKAAAKEYNNAISKGETAYNSKVDGIEFRV